MSIRRGLLPGEWNEESQAVRYPPDNPARWEYLKGVEELVSACACRMNGVIRKLDGMGVYTVGDVLTRYRRSTDQSRLAGYAEGLSLELARGGQCRTAKAYGTVCRGLVAFNGGVDVPLEQVDAALVKAFESHLKENGRQPNTISYYMRNLRAIYNKALREGRVSVDKRPFAGVFTGVEETRKRALAAGEVNRLREIDLDGLLRQQQPGTRREGSLRNLDRSRRLFFFCLYAQGMCFVDLCYLKKAHVKGGVIRYYRKKTGRQIEVPVNEGMRKIIESFADETAGSEYLFPMLAGSGGNPRLAYESALRVQNLRLKRLAAMAGLETGVATHVARHSWANILKNCMHPLSVISEGLGHSSEKMTRKYLASFDRSILADAGKAMLTAVSSPAAAFVPLF